MSCRSALVWGILVGLLAACGGDGDVDSGSTTLQPPGATTTTGVDPPGEPLFAGVDETVTLLTPALGGGLRPLLEWEPVSGADHYGAYLYAPDGSIYWAWTGRPTQVHVGGEPRLEDRAPGPSVVDGMSWAVIAYDAELLPIAVSSQRPIGP